MPAKDERKVGPSSAAWFGAGCWLSFLLIGATYFIYGSDLLGYFVGTICIVAAVYWMRRELRWATVASDRLVVRGLLYRREYLIAEQSDWAVSPVRSGLPFYTIHLLNQDESIVRLESLRYTTETKATAVAERLFPKRL